MIDVKHAWLSSLRLRGRSVAELGGCLPTSDDGRSQRPTTGSQSVQTPQEGVATTRPLERDRSPR
eukprot:4772777-Pleurochrysis_carterae.AAC.1